MKELLSKNNKENIKRTNQTWVVKNEKGEIVKRVSPQTYELHDAVYYGKIVDIVKIISYKEWKEMATLEIINKGGDERNHKPITKEELENLLEEEVK